MKQCQSINSVALCCNCFLHQSQAADAVPHLRHKIKNPMSLTWGFAGSFNLP